jgi:hypothetical protein
MASAAYTRACSALTALMEQALQQFSFLPTPKEYKEYNKTENGERLRAPAAP